MISKGSDDEMRIKIFQVDIQAELNITCTKEQSCRKLMDDYNLDTNYAIFYRGTQVSRFEIFENFLKTDGKPNTLIFIRKLHPSVEHIDYSPISHNLP